jgi:hypothetical protein
MYVSKLYLRENSQDAIRIIEKPKIEKKRKFLYQTLRQRNLIAQNSEGASTNPHFLYLAHTVHVCTVGCISSLFVHIVAKANDGIIYSRGIFIANYHLSDGLITLTAVGSSEKKQQRKVKGERNTKMKLQLALQTP